MPTQSKWKKADATVAARFEAALPDHPKAERKKMFGYPACFVNGNFFTGMHEGATVVVRLPGGLRDAFPVLARAEGFDPMRNGKGMKDWWVIPAAIVKSDAKLEKLLGDTFKRVLTLPARAPKPKKALKDKPAKARATKR